METLSSSKTQSWLSWFLKGFLILGFLVLVGRLIDLQIIKGDYYRSLAEGNRIRRVPIMAPRGKILARGGEVLVSNKEVKKRVVFDPNEGYKKITDIKGASEDEIVTEWVRYYNLGPDLAHVSGYLGEVDKDELGKVKAQCPGKGSRKLGSLVGRTGLEEKYDCLLLGIDGEELVEVDVQGNRVRSLGFKKPVPGEDIKTVIHYGLQEKVSELMKGMKGAVVVSDSKGEIMALYSSPSFDPNLFVEGDSQEISKLLNDSDLPLFNRSISGKYPPGSIYKPVVAVAALEEGKIDEDYIYEDTGQINIKTLYGDFTYSNWYFTQYGGVEGKINLVRAIARSTDTFFYKIGELVGIEKLAEWSHEFGLDGKTEIDLPGEIGGLIPSPIWKLREKGEKWFLGNTYHMAIGQGDIGLTPVGIHSAVSAIANGGVYCRPHIVGDGELVNGQCRNLGIEGESIDLVKQGMVGACSSDGTGYTFFDFPEKYGIEVACKTGTAETSDLDEETHAWFTAFAPVDFPEIIVTVLVEKGGEGSKVAGPIAREIFDFWFGKSETQNTKSETNSNVQNSND